VRDGDADRVLIVEELGAPRPRRRAGRRSKPIDPGDPEETPLTRVTVTGERLGDAAEGTAWLKEMMGSGGAGAEEVRVATRIVNRALSALRAAARDPLVQDIGATSWPMGAGRRRGSSRVRAGAGSTTSTRSRASRPCSRGGTRSIRPRL